MRKLLLGAVSAAAMFLAGCTSQQEQDIVSAACATAGGVAGLAATVTGLGTLVTTISGTASDTCQAWATAVVNTINEITNGGATANVSVAASTPAAQADMRRLAGRYGLTPRRLGAKTVVHFTVSPSGSVTQL